jgi:hypothetical protein
MPTARPRPSPARRRTAAAALAAALALALAGCEHHRPDRFAQAVDAGERPVAMRGAGDFFGGQIAATVTISRGVGRGLPAGGGGREGGRRKGGDESPDLSGMDQDAVMSYLQARAELGSPLPPVTIRLKLVNDGKQVVQVDVSDFNSYLGDFAVQPELLSLAPGQSAEPSPMISQLGVSSDVIPFTITLHQGSKAETRVIPVKNLADSADASAAQ